MIEIKNWKRTGIKKPFKDIEGGEIFIFTDDVDIPDRFDIWLACEFNEGYIPLSTGNYIDHWIVGAVNPNDECELVSATIEFDNT